MVNKNQVLYYLLGLIILTIRGVPEILEPYEIPSILQPNTSSFSKDMYYVQGIASTCESNQSCNDETVYISIDYKKGTYNKKSIILAYSGNQKSANSCYVLSDNSSYATGHFDGLAYYNKKLYIVSSGKGVVRIKLPALTNDFNNSLDNCHSLNTEVEYKVNVTNSISTVIKGEQRYFLIGKYHKSDSDYQSYAYLYKIDKFSNVENTNEEIDLTKEYTQKYKLPLQQTQGVDIQRIKDKEYLIISANHNTKDNIDYNNKSRLYWYLLSDLVCQNDIDCPSTKQIFDIKAKHIVRGYEYPEDLAVTPTKLWTLSESRRNKQKIYYIPLPSLAKKVKGKIHRLYIGKTSKQRTPYIMFNLINSSSTCLNSGEFYKYIFYLNTKLDDFTYTKLLDAKKNNQEVSFFNIHCNDGKEVIQNIEINNS